MTDVKMKCSNTYLRVRTYMYVRLCEGLCVYIHIIGVNNTVNNQRQYFMRLYRLNDMIKNKEGKIEVIRRSFKGRMFVYTVSVCRSLVSVVFIKLSINFFSLFVNG